MRWLALFLVVLALAAGCGGRYPLPPGEDAAATLVVCVDCSAGPCDLCLACRQTPAADEAASCPPSSAACEEPLPAGCVVQRCAACP